MMSTHTECSCASVSGLGAPPAAAAATQERRAPLRAPLSRVGAEPRVAPADLPDGAVESLLSCVPARVARSEGQSEGGEGCEVLVSFASSARSDGEVRWR